MTQSGFGDPGNNPWAQAAIDVFRSFSEELLGRDLDRPVAAIESDSRVNGAALGQEPERFTEEHLIRPLAEQALGYDYRPVPAGLSGLGTDTPDFEVLNAQVTIIGEIKGLGRVDDARTEIHGYLDEATVRPMYGIATSGTLWQLVEVPPRGSPRIQSEISVKGPLTRVRRFTNGDSGETSERALREAVAEFVETFHVDQIDTRSDSP